MLALILPLLPLSALPILYLSGVLDDFWAHFAAVFYMAWLLIAILPTYHNLRIVLRITMPVVMLSYAINSDALSPTTGEVIGLFWLVFMGVLLIIAKPVRS